MPIPQLSDAPGVPSLTAQVELLSSIIAVYFNRQDSLSQIITALGGGAILAWHFDEDSLPPSYAVWRVGTTVVVTFAGTVNRSQIFREVTGSLAVRYPGFVNRVHSFFHSTWTDIRNAVNAAIPAGVAQHKLIFTGHSMGFATAQAASWEWARQIGASHVGLLGFAGPKLSTSGYAGARPAEEFCVNSEGDLVPFLPPNNVIAVLPIVSNPWVDAVPTDWTHYGTFHSISAAGNYTSRQPDYYSAVYNPLRVWRTIDEHSSARYANRVEQALRNRGIDVVHQGIIDTSVFTRGLASPQVLVDNFGAPRIDRYDELNVDVFADAENRLLNPQNIETVEFVSGTISIVPQDSGAVGNNNSYSGNNSMADCIGKMYFKTQQINRSTTWIETMGVRGGPADAITRLVALAEKRVQLLGSGVACTQLIVSDVAITGDSLARTGIQPLTNSGSWYYNEAYMSKLADFSDRTVLVRMQATDATYRTRRSYELRGAPDDFYVINKLTIVDPGWVAKFNDYKAQLQNGDYGVFTLRNTANDPKFFGVVPVITPVAEGVPAYVTFNIPAHGLANGELVRLGGIKTQGVPKAPRGIFQVAYRTDDTFRLLGCRADWIYLSGGYVSKRTKTLSLFPTGDVNAIQQIRISSKKSGLPYDASRGRLRRPRS